MESVLTFKIDKLLAFQAKGKLSTHQSEYLARVKEDNPDADGTVLYESNRSVEDVQCWREGALKPVEQAGTSIRALPVFFESRYLFRIKFEKPFPKRVDVDHPMAAIADGFQYEDGTLWGDIDFVNSPGVFSLKLKVVHADNRSEEVELKMPVVSVKMNVERDYRVIKEDIQNASPGLVLAFLAKTFGESGFDRNGGKQTQEEWFAILQMVFDSYEVACRKIILDPHRRYVAEPVWLRADRIKRWTPQQVNVFARADTATQVVMRFRATRISPAIDTPENRFVLHTLKSLSGSLADFAGRYAGREGVNEAFVKNIKARADELKRLSCEPFFKGVGRFEGFKQQSLVLQRKPGYAQILVAWLKLQQALTPTSKGVQIGYRPISALYEFWCFLEFKKLMSEALQNEGEDHFEKGDIDNVLDKEDLKDGDKETKTLSKLVHIWKVAGVTYTIAYQKTFGQEGEDRTYAIDYLQRPDIVFTIWDDNTHDEFTYLFDSKYRVSTMDGKDASPRDAIDEMHRYRDAILYRKGDGKQQSNREAIGAYVLFPGRSGDRSYDYPEKRDIENIGAIALLPGEEGEAKLKAFIHEIIDKKTKKEHLEKAIPPRGAEISLEPVIGEDAILKLDWTNWGGVDVALSSGYFPVRVDELDAQGKDTNVIKRIEVRRIGKAVATFSVCHVLLTEPKPGTYLFAMHGGGSQIPECMKKDGAMYIVFIVDREKGAV